MRVFSGGVSLPGSPEYHRWIKSLEPMIMSEKTEHALDIGEDYLIDALHRCKEIETLLMMWLIAVTSGRPEDILNAVEFHMQGNRIAVNWGLRKNRRTKALQDSCIYDIPPYLMSVSRSLTSRLKRLHQSNGRSIDASVQAVNAYLASLPPPTLNGQPVYRKNKVRFATTYSIRRHAIHRFVDEHRLDSGLPDWDCIIRKTGHLSSLIPENVYLKKAAQILAESEHDEAAFEEEDDD
jgi:hypothetical protein